MSNKTLCILRTNKNLSKEQIKRMADGMTEQLNALGLEAKTSVLTDADWNVEFVKVRDIGRKLTLGERFKLLFTG